MSARPAPRRSSARLRSRLDPSFATSQRLETLPHGAPVRVAGLVVCRQRPATAKGITFLLLEDELGLVNVIVAPDRYERQRSLVRATPLLIVKGRLQKLKNTINVLAMRLWPLENTKLRLPTAVPETDEPPAEEVDPRTVRLVDLTATAEIRETAEARMGVEAIRPPAHEYR